MEPVMKAEEAAKVLKISVQTLRALMRDGKIKYSVVGKHPRFTEQQVRDYLEREER